MKKMNSRKLYNIVRDEMAKMPHIEDKKEREKLRNQIRNRILTDFFKKKKEHSKPLIVFGYNTVKG